MPRLREILAEVERRAIDASDFDEHAIREFHDAYREATNALAPTWRGVGSSVVVGGVVSLVTMPIAGLVGLAVGGALSTAFEVGRHLRDRTSRKNSWMSAADSLSALAEDPTREGA
jgi:hypothetical protein